MEKARIRKSLLFTLYSNQRHQFLHQLHLPGTKNQIRRRKDCRMCTLRLQRLLRLKNIIISSNYISIVDFFKWVKLITTEYSQQTKRKTKIQGTSRSKKLEDPRNPKKISSTKNRPPISFFVIAYNRVEQNPLLVIQHQSKP